MDKVINELREGGPISYEFRNADGGRVLPIKGAYKEVKEKEKLVYTWTWKFEEERIGNAEYLL